MAPVTTVPAAPREDGVSADGALRVGGADITVVFDGDPHNVTPAGYRRWVADSAQMIADYYEGTLPVPSLEVTIVRGGRGGVGFGQHRRGRWIKVYCGRSTRERSFDKDWVMVHEMLHASFPDLSDTHRWMQEGLSTYVEKLVRVRAGNIDEQAVWSRLSASMHHGRPKRGDRGLDRTHTWGRTYWGGALFWLVADVDVRDRTNNAKSLRDALLHIANQGGNARQMWSTDQVCSMCDEGTGTTAVSELYARMAKAPGDVDLDRLWAELGVVRAADGSVYFDDEAPLAHVRRGIVA